MIYCILDNNSLQASYQYYMANFRNPAAGLNVKETVIPLMKKIGNTIIFIKRIHEAVERSKFTRTFQENFISG